MYTPKQATKGTVMKKYLLMLLCAFISTQAYSEAVEIDKKIVCDNTKNMLPQFKTQHGEIPMWIGNVKKDTMVAVLVNSESQTWSVVMFNQDATCLLESGEGFKFKPPSTAIGTAIGVAR
jgi:hypothetical protein